MRLYLDASVLIPLFVEEATSEWVQERLAQPGDVLIVSDFAVAEVSSTVSRLVRTGRQTARRGRELLDLFDLWRTNGTQHLSIESEDI